MSDTSSLTELARFTASSPLAAEHQPTRRAALETLAHQIAPKAGKPRVTELLGTVLALSARTRRVVQTPVIIDLDVFAPAGRRAVRMRLGA